MRKHQLSGIQNQTDIIPNLENLVMALAKISPTKDQLARYVETEYQGDIFGLLNKARELQEDTLVERLHGAYEIIILGRLTMIESLLEAGDHEFLASFNCRLNDLCAMERLLPKAPIANNEAYTVIGETVGNEIDDRITKSFGQQATLIDDVSAVLNQTEPLEKPIAWKHAKPILKTMTERKEQTM